MRPEVFHQRNTVTRRGINLEIFSTRGAACCSRMKATEMFME